MSYPIKDFKERAEKLVALEMFEKRMEIIIRRVLKKLKTKSRKNKIGGIAAKKKNKNKKLLQWLRSILNWTRKDKDIKKEKNKVKK